MSKTAIFSRANHPQTMGSHAYSTLFVGFESTDDLEAVRKALVYGPGLPEPMFGVNHWWYGGHFDLVGIIDGKPEQVGHSWSISPDEPMPVLRSMGDNRFVGWYDAQDLLCRISGAVQNAA